MQDPESNKRTDSKEHGPGRAGPGLNSSRIFELVRTYRAGFRIRIEGRQYRHEPVEDEAARLASRAAAAELLEAFEPLLVEYQVFLRTGIPSRNTQQLARYFLPEVLALTMQSFDDEDIAGELRLCLLRFCLKWDGIVQNFHWEVSNWISQATRDIITRRSPLTQCTTLHEPDSPVLQRAIQDFSDEVLESLERQRIMAWLRQHVPDGHNSWTSLFSQEECSFLQALLNGRADEEYTSTKQQALIDRIAEKVRAILESDQVGAEPESETIYGFEPLF